MSDGSFVLRPVGRIATPWSSTSECPRNGRQLDPAPVCTVTVFDPFTAGLQGLDGMSHLILLYWLDQSKAPRLVFTPPFDQTPRGIFATRGPDRPNPIGMSVVAFEGYDGANRLKVRFLDCVDGTPLLDIKPYLPTTDAEPTATMGWLTPHATRNPNTGGSDR